MRVRERYSEIERESRRDERERMRELLMLLLEISAIKNNTFVWFRMRCSCTS